VGSGAKARVAANKNAANVLVAVKVRAISELFLDFGSVPRIEEVNFMLSPSTRPGD
jgi:hypothetical protein